MLVVDDKKHYEMGLSTKFTFIRDGICSI